MRREKNISKYVFISIMFIVITIILLTSLLISRGVKNKKENEFAEEISELTDEMTKTDVASSSIGKNVEESKKELSKTDKENDFDVPELSVEENESQNKKVNKKTENQNENKTSKTKTKKTNSTSIKEKNDNSTKDKNIVETNVEVKNKKEEKIEMEIPIKGKIIREFAKDSLVYSNTLQEWITHNGIDIKADKTSVVKAVARGTVSDIKNDPRYGLTVIILHDNGDKTVYSNLLTSEFVVKGEKVDKGQSIGTVGNSASFEIEDEYHLHFELIKNNEYVDPTIYINFK